MPEPQPGADRPADGGDPVTGRQHDPVVTAGPADLPVPPHSGPTDTATSAVAPASVTDGDPARPADDGPAPAPPADPVTPPERTPAPEPAAPAEPANPLQPATPPDQSDPPPPAAPPLPANPATPTEQPGPTEPATPTGQAEQSNPPQPATPARGVAPGPVSPARGSAAVPARIAPPEPPAPGQPDPTRQEQGPDPTRQEQRPDLTRQEQRPDPTLEEPAAPRWSGSAAVPAPPPRRRGWGESAEPTPVPPPLPPELPEHRAPVDPWAGADTGGWDLHHPELTPLPPTMPYPASPPPTRPYPAAPAPAAEPQKPSSAPPAQSAPSYQRTPTPPYPQALPPGPATPSPTRPYPVASAPAARPVSPPPPPAPARPALPPPPPPAQRRPLPPPPAPPRPPKQRRVRPEPVAPAPDPRRPPKGRRKRRRWPWVLLLSLACCCGCPAWFARPAWQQYPADAALPRQVADLTLREDSGSEVDRLKTEVRKANMLAEDVYAGVYSTSDGKRVIVFGDTGFRFRPESDADDAMVRLTDTFGLGTPQPVDSGVRGRYERCATGSSDGTDVVVCTSVDHGSSATGVFTRLSVDDSARLLATMRTEIVTPKQG